MASMVARSSLVSWRLAPSMTSPRGPPCSSTNTLRFVPFLPRSVGFLPTFFPPEPGLAHGPVGALPLPMHCPEFGALLHQQGPDAAQDALLAPALEPAMHGTVVAELLGEFVPLAAAAHAEEDAIQGAPPVGALAAGALGRGILQENRFDPLP